jgi:hypothetical protein
MFACAGATDMSVMEEAWTTARDALPPPYSHTVFHDDSGDSVGVVVVPNAKIRTMILASPNDPRQGGSVRSDSVTPAPVGAPEIDSPRAGAMMRLGKEVCVQ